MDTLYKVLVDGKSCHGGSHTWSLPSNDGPGEWHEIPPDVPLSLCDTGFHITPNPGAWYKTGATIYVAEHEGDETQYSTDDGCKVAVRKVRLLRVATAAELAAVGVYTEGEHTVSSGSRCYAFGNSTVDARGNSVVDARDNSKVDARGTSKVDARGNSVVTAWDNSVVDARGNSKVTAWDTSKVTARDNSTVKRIEYL